MRKDKEKAVALRRLGKSYKYIESSLGVPKSTLHDWFSQKTWSKKIKQELQKHNREWSRKNLRKVAMARSRGLKQEYLVIRKQAVDDFEKYKHDPLFTAGLCLYWGEGYKNKKGDIRITNTDPGLLNVYKTFLERFFPEDFKKIKIHLLLYPDLDEKTCIGYWSKKLGISKGMFIRSTYIQGKHATRRLPHGIVMLYFCSRSKKEKLLQWIECMAKERALG